MMPSFLHLVCVLITSMIAIASAEVNRIPPTELEITIKSSVPSDKCTHKIELGDTAAIRYRANIWKQDKIFDQSGQKYPFEFIVGRSDMEIPKGLHEGLVGACVGERRHILMPQEYGFMPDPVYGYSSAPKAPYGSFLEYNVQVVKIVPRYSSEEHVIEKEHEVERDEL
ncbi:hypothetical protein BDR26DRAFT_917303 [Obelidium mucronatum]|nr:hypothetical protein BDR26DRAFT_917303 [Obelidium mucronatum]